MNSCKIYYGVLMIIMAMVCFGSLIYAAHTRMVTVAIVAVLAGFVALCCSEAMQKHD